MGRDPQHTEGLRQPQALRRRPVVGDLLRHGDARTGSRTLRGLTTLDLNEGISDPANNCTAFNDLAPGWHESSEGRSDEFASTGGAAERIETAMCSVDPLLAQRAWFGEPLHGPGYEPQMDGDAADDDPAQLASVPACFWTVCPTPDVTSRSM